MTVHVLVSFEFGFPEVAIGTGHSEEVTIVSVPETAVDENHGAIASQHKVRCARKNSLVKPITEPSRKQASANR